MVSRATRSRNHPHLSSNCALPPRASLVGRARSDPVQYGGQTPMGTQQRPAAGDESRPPRRMPSRRKPSFRIDQRAQVLEPVGGHEARRGKLPKRIFDNARELARVGNHVSQKRRASAAQGLEHLAGGARQPLFPVRRLAVCGRARSRSIEQPRRVLPQEQGDRRRPRRPHPPGVVALPSVLIFKGGMRRQASPDDLTRNAQLIEQLRRFQAGAAARRLPGCRRYS